MVWDRILIGNMRLVIIRGNLNAERYRDEILQPVPILYLHRLGPNSKILLQDDNAYLHRVRFISSYLHNWGNGEDVNGLSAVQNPTEHLWDQLGSAVCARVTNTTTLADLQQMLLKNRMWC